MTNHQNRSADLPNIVVTNEATGERFDNLRGVFRRVFAIVCGQVRNGGHDAAAPAPSNPAARTRSVPMVARPAPGRPAAPAPARPNPATRVQPALPQMFQPAGAVVRPGYGPGTITANRTPQPVYPAAPRSAAPAATNRARRRTGLSVLLALIVLMLAVVVLVVVNQLVGELSAAEAAQTWYLPVTAPAAATIGIS